MAHLKNLFNGTWSYGSYRNDGVWLPSPSPENPSNNIGETEYIKIDPNKPATFSWSGWSKSIPSNVTIHSYHTDSDSTSYAKVVIDRLSQTVTNNSITFENADEADYIRFYFHGSGSATQYQPLGFQITQAGVFDDVAFKVIVKNDGISDVIFKTMMLKGEAGGTIASIEKTSTSGVVDTYTITLNDGTTTTFEVTNGSNIQSIEKTATAGLIDTYTVTLTNGDTSTFEVKNGEDAQLYELPQNCVVGYDVDDALVNYDGLGTHVQLEDANGIKSIHLDGMTYQKSLAGINLFDINLLDKTDITIDGNEASATDTNFHTNFQTGVFPSSLPNNQYALSFKAYTDGNQSASGAGLVVGFIYTDNTRNYVTIQNSITSYESFSIVSDNGKTVSNVLISYATSGGNIWHLKDIQLEVGSQAMPYEPYCGGKPSPSPSYPQEIEGIGELQSNNTYSFDLGVEDTDGNMYTITVSGLSHPILSGDSIDIFNGVVRRNMGWAVFDGSSDENWIKSNSNSGNYYLSQWANNNSFANSTNHKQDKLITLSSSDPDRLTKINICYFDSDLNMKVDNSLYPTASDFKTFLSNNPVTMVYPLTTATEESVTISGDIGIIQRMRGMFIDIYAPDHTSQIWGQYYEEPEFPDGYEEIDFPLDDMFYYQDGEYVDFPKNWGFVMGYVFDANTIRFVMNVTKQLKEGMTVDITRSADLSLNTYAGAGDVGILSGFSGNAVSWIPELGQIQISLTTESPHGLTPNMLLGARVATGTLRIYFVED